MDIKENFKNFIDKNNYIKIKLILSVIFSLILSVICENTILRKYYPEYISKNRIMLITIFLIFISLHLIFKLSEMYEWIHKHRYKIAGVFLLFVMLFKYSGSSIVNFNMFIQPNNDDRKYHTLLGKPRMIRTDEWATATPYILSQAEGQNKFQYFSNKLRGTTTDMFTLINTPVYDILMIGKPFQWAFLLFGNEAGLSFFWYAKITFMLLGSYEICLILTNKKKRISLCGMLVIAYSAAVQWWYCMDALIWGQIILVLVNKFMITDKKKEKYLCALGLVITILAYIFVLYPPWQISLAYVFLAIAIWMIVKNFKNGYKLTKHDIMVAIITIICIVALLGRWYIKSNDIIKAEMNTAYPGDRCETGGGAFNLYSYFYNIFFTFEDFPNPCEYSSMLSFFPIPIILGLVYVIKNKKNLLFWIPTLVCSLFLTIWCKVGFPLILAKLTLMSNVTAPRATIALGVINIYMLIYLIGSIEKEDKWINKKLTYFLAVLITGYIIYQARKTCDFLYIDKFKILAGGEIFLAVIFGILNVNNEKIRNYTIYSLMGIALLTGFRVHPVIRTTNIMYKKPVAIKMQEIRDENPDAIWVIDEDSWFINDYTVANGIRTLNSTNVYPNLEMFETILEDRAEEYEYIYNRYEHINFNIVDKESDVELLVADCVRINLNYHDLSKLNIEYVLSREDLNEKGFDMEFEEVYYEDGLYIFKVLDK